MVTQYYNFKRLYMHKMKSQKQWQMNEVWNSKNKYYACQFYLILSVLDHLQIIASISWFLVTLCCGMSFAFTGTLLPLIKDYINEEQGSWLGNVLFYYYSYQYVLPKKLSTYIKWRKKNFFNLKLTWTKIQRPLMDFAFGYFVPPNH